MKSIATFLMFVGEQAGKAEEAITFYTSLFRDSKIVSIERYGADESEPEGSIKVAKFTLNGAEYMAIDSHIDHQFAFTPRLCIESEPFCPLRLRARLPQGSET